MGKLDGKVAFVTGAAMGNGAGIAHVFAELGAKVLLVDISEKVHETAKEIVSKGLEAASYEVDVTDFAAVKEITKDAYEKYGKIEEVGQLAGFLASDESSYITGTHIVIDGGSTLPETVSVGVE